MDTIKFIGETNINDFIINKSDIKESIRRNCKFESEDIRIPEETIHIRDLQPSKIINIIDKKFIGDTLNQLGEKLKPNLQIPIRRRENIVYNKNQHLFLGRETRTLEYGDKYSEYLKILKVAEFVKELLKKNLHATKREIFYTAVNLFENQKYSDRAIEDLATILGVFRENLQIVASKRGTCIGSLKIKETGYRSDKSQIIDLENLGSSGWTISPLLDQVEILESDAEFILVLEKDAAIMRLAEYRLWDKIPCILLTSQGSPSYAPRRFLKRLVSELEIPAFGIADADPYGLGIMMTYAYGGVQSAYETSKLAVNNFYWLGVTPQDIEDYNIPRDVQISMHKEDLKRIKFMRNEPPIQNHKKLREQLNLMKKLKTKVEIQALAVHGFNFFIKYIFKKIEEGTLIKL